MEYMAMHFVRINGRMYTEGEIITEEIDGSKAARLLEKGAIKAIAPDQHADITETHVDVKQPVKHEPVKTSEPEAEAHTEVDDDAEVPEIDVMEGLVGAKKKPRRTRK